MKHIPLTQGQFAIVDDEDFERTNQFKWSAMKITRKSGTVFYAKRVVWDDWKDKKQHIVLLHRFILEAPVGFDVDHKNNEPLDCRKENLRLATRQQNNQNRLPREDKYKGVHFQPTGPRRRRFTATIGTEGKTTYLGCFHTATEAARAYDAKAKELFGEFAKLNFPERV
jgi:hypothetical protein